MKEKNYNNYNKQAETVPIQEKYCLTISQAAQYFNIGENSMRKIVADNPTADFVLTVGKKILIKRKLFERFIDESTSII